jgi:putative chitinase
MLPVDADILRAVAPSIAGAKGARQASIIEMVGDVLAARLDSYAINTRLRIAHFIAQTCTESDGYSTTEEYASGAAYEGRADLGNTQKGDGRLFKGRGLLQLTGRANYTAYGKALGLDLVGNPALAAEPAVSLTIACEYWKRRAINAMADADDLYAVTRAVNGGLNGLDSRRAYLTKAKTALATLEAQGLAASAGATVPVLRRGSSGEAVAALQKRLRALGYAVVADGSFGPATEVAVSHFQSAHKLPVDGIVGPATAAAIAKG